MAKVKSLREAIAADVQDKTPKITADISTFTTQMNATLLQADKLVDDRNVESVRVMRDAATGRARGFAFVEMADTTGAQRAISRTIGAAGCTPRITASSTMMSGAHSRNFVLCPGRAYDRSPCGTGTSAKLACLAADGKLAELTLTIAP